MDLVLRRQRHSVNNSTEAVDKIDRVGETKSSVGLNIFYERARQGDKNSQKIITIPKNQVTHILSKKLYSNQFYGIGIFGLNSTSNLLSNP